MSPFISIKSFAYLNNRSRFSIETREKFVRIISLVEQYWREKKCYSCSLENVDGRHLEWDVHDRIQNLDQMEITFGQWHRSVHLITEVILIRWTKERMNSSIFSEGGVASVDIFAHCDCLSRQMLNRP